MKKNVFSRFLVLLILSAVLLVGCTDQQAGDSTANTEVESSLNDANNDAIYLVKDGKAEMRLVLPLQNGSVALNDAIVQLQKEIRKVFGLELSKVADKIAVSDGKKGNILLGATEFDLSQAEIANLGADRFAIVIENGQIAVVADNDLLYSEAVKHLWSIVTVSENCASLPSNYRYISDAFSKCEIVKDGKSDYTIVYDHNSDLSLYYAELIQSKIQSLTGVKIPMKRDSAIVDGMYEILVGETDRDFSIENQCKYMNYGVCYDSEYRSIALTGQLGSAIENFERKIDASAKKGSLLLYHVLFGTFTVDGCGTIPSYRDDEYDFIGTTEYNSYYVKFEDASEQEYRSYLEKLETEEGFTQYSTREVNGNLFATYTDGYTILSVSYTAYEKAVRIAADTMESSALPTLKSDLSETVTTPQLTQINGVCSYLIRLSDGRFIVYDGGMNYEKNYKTLYQQMVAQNVLEGKPVIAAWIFSHMHNDHVGTFVQFSEYASQIEVQNIILNIPGYEIYTINGSVVSTDPTSMNRYGIPMVKKTIEQSFSKAQIIIPHAGQIMWFGDAMIDILYTQENLAPIEMTNTNDSSVVFTVNIAGQRLTFLGDLGYDGAEIVYKMYGNTLKCNTVQIAHHGFNGGDEEMYAAMDADTALWTSPYTEFLLRELWKNEENRFDFNSVEENLVMPESDVMIMPLPHIINALPTYVRNFY